jgi:hypothetical protein
MRALLLCLLLAACGGGSVGPSTGGGVITPGGMLRTDLLFGFFAQDSATVLETQPFANLLWTSGDSVDQVAAISLAKADGRKVVAAFNMCLVPPDQGEATARWWLGRLHDAGLLGNVVAIAWCDEPNTARAGSWTSENAIRMNAAVRAAMAGYPELHAVLAVIYACRGSWPAIADFDWIGCDDYDSGCDVLKAIYPRIPVRAGQRLIVVPGGASPWRQDPACFLAFAEGDSRVVAIVAFIWQTVVDGATYEGIRVNGMRALYEQAGRTVVAPGA